MSTQLRSMTGFGTSEQQKDGTTVKAELKSVNNKFLDLTIRLPRSFKDKETELRQQYITKIGRGSVFLNVSFEKSQTDSFKDKLQINEALAKAYQAKLQALANNVFHENISLFEQVIKLPDVLRFDEEAGMEEEWDFIKTTLEKAFEDFDRFRLQEGEKLKAYLIDCLNGIEKWLAVAEEQEQGRKTSLRGRLLQALKETKEEESIHIDMNRFEQEIIYYLEKYDIAEEKSRLKNHLRFFIKTLNDEANGKKLSFISQEMGREINTIGSKANYFPIQEAVVNMKEELEKIKEQLMNVL